MKCCILMGSPHKEGNTASLLRPFVEAMTADGYSCEVIWLYDKELLPCLACRGCQTDWSSFACVRHDDMGEIATQVLACDLLVLATPIHSWYCTPPMKAVLDRLVYGLNKYYGERRGPSLWKGKRVALISTCGYPAEKGADLWEEGVRRYCKHAQLIFVGMLAERHLGYQTTFFDEEKEARVISFAHRLAAQHV